ncbi:MAG TPA: ABC transporter substrate-binding protein, partial [Dokdonella sp.]|nr:ABC transporter substrate-binding protein [Dokdonella sp.]
MKARIRLASLVLPLALVACGAQRDERVTLRFWAIGREAEVVPELLVEFERLNPHVLVEVQA